MINSIRFNIFKKIQYPPSGFILQRDVYTTNLLYANHQFPLTSLKQRLPFRPKSGKKINIPNNSIRILRESQNCDKKNKFYSLNDLKPRNLNKKKLKFPLIRIKTIPLTNLNLHENISKKDIKIKNMDDDLNITSNKGRKIFFRFKDEKKISNIKKFNLPSIIHSNINFINKKYNIIFRHRKKKQNDISMDKNSLNNIVDDLNKELNIIKRNEKKRKRSFIKDTFFSTQIYVENIIDSNRGINRSMNLQDYNYY